MKPYIEWLNLAKRYDKIVDYGSPITSWTKEMLQALNNANGNKIEAMEQIKQLLIDSEKGE